MKRQHERCYVLPGVTEKKVAKTSFEPDDFAEGLSLNYEAIGGYCIIAYAKSLVGTELETPHLTAVEAPPSNVRYLEDYRHGTEPEAA